MLERRADADIGLPASAGTRLLRQFATHLEAVVLRFDARENQWRRSRRPVPRASERLECAEKQHADRSRLE
ncbi:hypothetical protein ACT4ML_01570 [Natrinema sp. LN54]|uniref:hypothetical protein n=1 Tax=Natrinema sp. LN54 TaxID=3458705 RepID=UPI004037571B